VELVVSGEAMGGSRLGASVTPLR